jgi:hypothetical protein
VYLLGSLGRGGMTPLKLTVAGAALTALLSSLTQAILVLNERTLDEIRFWLAGSVADRSLELYLHVVPYLGVGALLNYARGQPVDLTPNIDATACAAGTDPVCNAQGLGASDADLAHDRAFKKLLLMRYRALLGLWLRVRMFAFAAEATIDLARPDQADSDVKAKTARQWSLSFAPSISF